MAMSVSMKKNLCRDYFYYLVDTLKDTHELVESCNADETLYLIPKGSISELSYTSKPVDSYRYSDHWNWYANLKKCPVGRYIQCYNPDLPRAKPRAGEGLASKPVKATCIAYYGEDKKYHTIYGEKFDRKEKTWSWYCS